MKRETYLPTRPLSEDAGGPILPTFNPEKPGIMHNIRIIARLDIKGDRLIKSVQLEGVRVVGDPHEHARRYYVEGADEILLMDAVASLYGRNHLFDIIRYTAEHVFIPVTVGGGLRSLEDVEAVLKAGADKVAINTAVVKNPDLINSVATHFGTQCMVLQVDAKKKARQQWEVYIDGGRERTGLDVVEWIKTATALGAGEILLTAIDREGTRLGYDIELCRLVSNIVPIPVIASGGMGSIEHLIDVIRVGCADAVAMADILHIRKKSIKEIKAKASSAGIPIRLK
jgi:imidazole glycerol-phosphate synthase subunit HisF